MNLIELLRAKSERECEEGKNILLKDHIIETLERAKQLKEFVETNGDTITYPPLKDEKFFTALAVALILHDFGKINYDFQRRVYDKETEKWKELEEFLRELKGIRIDHETLSSIWTSILLNDENKKEWKNWFSKIRTAILLHHYNDYYIGEKDLMEIAQDYFENVGKYLEFVIDRWQEFERFLNDLLSEIKGKFNVDFIKNAVEIIRDCLRMNRAEELLKMIKNREDDISAFAEFYQIDNENPDYGFLVFLGCLRRCDYSASGELDLEKIDENKKTLIKLKDIYKDLGDSIKEKIQKEPDWQKKILKEVEPLKSMILIAPTGSGKTEFALLWNSKNARKLIYTLPLRVALNELFWRFKNNYFGDEVDILHSTAFIEYLEEEQKGEKLNVERQLTTSKLLSSPILLTTPDQVFLTSLNYYGSDKVIAVYPLSSIVIDEIQTYDPEMASIIIKTLQIVRKLGGAVLVMTATLPPYFEPFFFESKSEDYNIPEEFRLNFKKIDTGNIKDYVKNYTLGRHKIEVVDDWLIKYVKEDNQYLIEVNEEQLDKYLRKYEEKNVFVVLNNVSKAIEVYKQLKDRYPNVFLLHSRLIEKEKDRKINLIKLLLKNSKSKKDIEKLKQNFENIDISKSVIIVATQIIEASVDLDFDVMITEVSPIDSQVQRWGRIYRNRSNKNYGEELPNIVIFVGKSENGEIKIDRGTKAIYDQRVVEKTIEVLKDFEGKILSYDDEKAMICEVFNKVVEVENPDIITLTGNTATLKDIYVAEIKQNLEFLKYFTVEKKSQAQRLFRRIAGIQVVIPEIMRHFGDDLERKFAEIVEDADSSKNTWDEIIDKLEDLLSKDIDKAEIKWWFKKILYEYSVNIPIFYWEDGRLPNLRTHEFKGFQVLKLSKEQAEKVYWYGIDEIFKMEEDVSLIF